MPEFDDTKNFLVQPIASKAAARTLGTAPFYVAVAVGFVRGMDPTVTRRIMDAAR